MGAISIPRISHFPKSMHTDLWDIGFAIVKMHGFEYSEACAKELFDFLKNAVQRLETDNPSGVDHEVVFKITHDFVGFIDKMIEAALEGDETRMLESDIFKRIRETFCPVYPFC
jgi:hypothetical protein